jgi:flagellar basal-body rod protein FlgB
MTVNRLFDDTTNLLARVLALRARKAEVIAGNLANIDTPGYRARQFDFEKQLRQALGEAPGEGALPLSRTDRRHLPLAGSLEGVRPVVTEQQNDLAGFDGNTVDLDREMAALAENSVSYNAAIEMLRKKLGILKNAIVEGGK